MRKWLGFGLVILLLLAFLPAGLGILAKKSLDKLVAELPMPESMTLSLQDYKFGWLSSYVAFKVHVVKTESTARYIADQTLDVIIHGDIAHGPILMTDKGLRTGVARIDTHSKAKDFSGLSARGAKELALFFKDNDILRASSLFQILRGITIDLSSSPIHVDLAGDNLQWNGFDAKIKLNHEFDQLHTHIIFSPILFTTQNGAILDTAKGEYIAQMYREEKSIWLGEQILTLPTFYLKDEQGAIMRFDHLRVMSVGNVIDHLLEASLDIEADNVEMNNQHIEQLRFDVEVSDFENDAVLALSKIIHKPQPLSADDKQLAFKLITEALAPGANIEVDYMLNMQSERVLLHGKLDFPNITDKFDNNTAVNAQQLLQGLNAQLDFTAPQPLVSDLLFDMTWSALTKQFGGEPDAAQEEAVKQMMDAQVQMLVDNGAFVQEGNNYHLEFDYEQGNMILNQKPVTQGELFLLIMLLFQVTPDESITH
ncbi:MAG: DUF945 family protein [Gammaproteobacteria bacterium]|jgi:uncharacterized protein YdgA (DUF945 family)